MTERIKRVNQRKNLEAEITHDNTIMCEALSESLQQIATKLNTELCCIVSDGSVKIQTRYSIKDKRSKVLTHVCQETSYPYIHKWFSTEDTYKQKIREVEKDIRRLNLVLNNSHVNLISSSGKVQVKIETRNRYF